MASSLVRVERATGVARVTLNQPPLNLVDPGLIDALADTFAHLAGEPSVRLAVLTGSGRAFCAGMNVHVLRALDVSGAKALITRLQRAIGLVHAAPFPVVGAVNGAALGAGFELALACDLRVAVSGALLGLPEVRVGVPSVIEAALLPSMVGSGRAAELLLSGEPVTADEALAWGLVNRVVPAAELEDAVERVVDTVLAGGPSAVRLQKELIVRWRQTDLATAVQLGINAFATAYATGEPQEGAAAFVEKRPARWRRL
ncbi:MAG: enoyl-CoA hydratase/isomerase family protein [Candidatus Rokubacteria bacterium]|nr:enoyl-CoA hydratase/isomerase family protein [Candidatus Rokubacteria bacterium]